MRYERKMRFLIFLLVLLTACIEIPQDPPPDDDTVLPPNDSPLPIITLPAGTAIIDLVECTGHRAGREGLTAISHATTSATSPDARYSYAGWLDGNDDAVIAAYDHHTGDCIEPTRLNEKERISGGSRHDQVGVGVDGEGYVYAAYFGTTQYRRDGSTRVESGTPMRRSLSPLDISQFTEKQKLRDFLVDEREFRRLHDGSLLVVGNDAPGIIDIIEPGGEYRWDAPRQVVHQDTRAKADHICAQNRFTKTHFHEGPDGTLYAVWGWGGGNGDCPDTPHYVFDSHEVFFAYSTDGGYTWKNREQTRTVESKPCREYTDCHRWNRLIEDGGIVHDDPDFMITPTRQRSQRSLWADETGDIYIAFAKSTWCDAGICLERDVTDPGALMLLRFNINEPNMPVQETMISNDGDHFGIVGIRNAPDGLYIWVTTRSPARFYEYVSYDNADTWTRTRPISGSCGRMSGNYFIPNQNIAEFIVECAGDPRGLYLYQRRFET